MKRHAGAPFVALLLFAATSFAVEGDTLWTRTYGGGSGEQARAITPSEDGNFLLAGYTISYGVGNEDVYLLKINPQGDTLWTRTYGGPGHDYAYAITSSGDGGFLIAGTSSVHGIDLMLVTKIDAQGNPLWSYTYGLGELDCCYALSITSAGDGGFLVAGIVDYMGMGEWSDGYIVKIDAQGNLLGAYVYGGQSDDWIDKIIPSGDGNFLLAGGTYNFGANGRDMWLSKITPQGSPIWNRTYGTAEMEHAHDVISTPDGGFLLAGHISSEIIWDFYVVKVNSQGDTIWTRTYGRPLLDEAYSIALCNDGNYLIAGWSFMIPYVDFGDFYLVKINPQGDTLWTRTYGGPAEDRAASCIPAGDGGHLVAGWTESFGAGSSDMHLIKVEGAVPSIHVTMNPVNPPIIIPATGGRFSFTIEIANNDTLPQTFDTWIMMELPNGNLHGPMLSVFGLTLPGGGSISRTRTQYVPIGAPEGQYYYIGYVGDYSNVVYDSSYFTFMKVCDRGWGSEVEEWNNLGESFANAGAQHVEMPLAAASLYPEEISMLVSPNPFNPSAAIRFQLSADSHVQLKVFDVAGRLVATLADGWREAGVHEVTFDGSDLPSGIYVYHLTAGEFTASGKMVLLK